jgi:hypothetical protein
MDERMRMELDRLSRGLELVVCVFWIVTFSVRLRSVRPQPGRRQPRPPLSAALRPIQLAAWTLVAVSLVLRTQAGWLPYAHAVFVPSLLAGWIATMVIAVDARRHERSGPTASEPA